MLRACSLAAAMMILLLGPARAAPDTVCKPYAEQAVRDVQENEQRRCGFTGPRWSTSYDAHFFWCQLADQAAIDAETAARKQDIAYCRANPPVVEAAPQAGGPVRGGQGAAGQPDVRETPDVRFNQLLETCAKGPGHCVWYVRLSEDVDGLSDANNVAKSSRSTEILIEYLGDKPDVEYACLELDYKGEVVGAMRIPFGETLSRGCGPKSLHRVAVIVLASAPVLVSALVYTENVSESGLQPPGPKAQTWTIFDNSKTYSKSASFAPVYPIDCRQPGYERICKYAGAYLNTWANKQK